MPQKERYQVNERIDVSDLNLTPLERKFVHYRAAGYSITDATINAGSTGNNPGKIGSEIASRPHVKQALARHQAATLKAATIDNNYVINNLMDIIHESKSSKKYGHAVDALKLLGEHLGMFPKGGKVVQGTETTAKDSFKTQSPKEDLTTFLERIQNNGTVGHRRTRPLKEED